MHTTVIKRGPAPKDSDDGDVRIHHNGDWSGDAILQWTAEGKTGQVCIPGWVARALGLEALELVREIAREGRLYWPYDEASALLERMGESALDQGVDEGG